MKILIVCFGNICRSPMAEVVINRLLESTGIGRSVLVKSAGTNAGRGSMDSRAQAVLRRRGYAPGKTKAKQIKEKDFLVYDLILAMDRANMSSLRRVAPAHSEGKLKMFLEFATSAGVDEVPDPYYGSIDGFERVLDLCEAGGMGLLRAIAQHSGPVSPR